MAGRRGPMAAPSTRGGALLMLSAEIEGGRGCVCEGVSGDGSTP